MRINISIPTYTNKNTMPFKKNNKLGFVSDNPLDKTPLTIKLRLGIREKIKSIPNWQDKLRDLLEEWVKQEKD